MLDFQFKYEYKENGKVKNKVFNQKFDVIEFWEKKLICIDKSGYQVNKKNLDEFIYANYFCKFYNEKSEIPIFYFYNIDFPDGNNYSKFTKIDI